MAEAIGVVASIIAILELSDTVIRYLNEVKNASKDCNQFITEISITSGILSSLQKLIDEQTSNDCSQWLPTIHLLVKTKGPLELYQDALKRIEELLEPCVKSNKFGNSLIWPFKQKEAQKLLAQIQRQHQVFILALVRDQMQLSKAIKDSLEDTKTKIEFIEDGVSQLQVFYQGRDAHNLSEKRKEVLSWLSNLQFVDAQNRALKQRQSGSGTWFLEKPRFLSWLSAKEKVLWCPGIPGAGKTTMASIVINHLEQNFSDPEMGIAFLYCSYNEQDQSALRLGCSVLQQLAWRRHNLSQSILGLYEEHSARRSEPTLEDVAALLKLESGRFKRNFVVIDALDECVEDERSQLIRLILDSISDCSLLVTSRELPSIEEDLGHPPDLKISANFNDVEAYIKDECRTSPKLKKHISESPTLEADITRTIMNNFGGMFLYAGLYMQSLKSMRTRKDVRSLLQSPPLGLDALFDQAMRVISQQNPRDRALANSIISWVAFAERPLTVLEMQHLLATDLQDEVINIDDLFSVADIGSVCAGLVKIEQTSINPALCNKRLAFIHFTAHDYFDQRREKYFPEWHLQAIKVCAHTLKARVHGSLRHSCICDPSRRVRLETFLESFWAFRKQERIDSLDKSRLSAFFNYAMDFLLGSTENDLSIEETIIVLRTPQIASKSWRTVQNRLGEFLHGGDRLRLSSAALDSTGDLLCLLCDSQKVRKHLQSLSVDSFTFRGTHEDVLLPNLAACLGFQHTLKHLLVSKGQSALDKLDASGLTVLTYAVIADSAPCVRLLLEMGASTQIGSEVFPLLDFLVVTSQSLHVLQVWLEVLVLSKTKLQRLLFIAVVRNCKEALSLLLNHSSKVYPDTGLQVEVLGLAIDVRNEDIMDLLLRHGANLDSSSPPAKGLIIRAVITQNIAVIRKLLDYKFDVNWKDPQGEHALLTAARGNLTEIASYLVQSGADISIRSKEGATAVQILLASFLAGSIKIDEAALQKSQDAGTGDAIKLLRSSANPFALCCSLYDQHVAASKEQEQVRTRQQAFFDVVSDSASPKSQNHPSAFLRGSKDSKFVYDEHRKKWIAREGDLKEDPSFRDWVTSYFR